MVYGVGGSKAPCSPSEARDVAAAAGDPSCVFYPRDAAATLHQHDGKGQNKYILPIRQDALKTQFSIKKGGVQNAIVFEGAALVQGVRRIVMNKRWHGKKAVVLVDAQALLFAIRKGRSSAYYLAPAVRKVGANCLAADLRIFPGYIPSIWNPPDPASRGLGSTAKHHKQPKSSERNHFLDHLHSVSRSVRHLKKRGAWPVASGTNSSWRSSNSSSMYGQPFC